MASNMTVDQRLNAQEAALKATEPSYRFMQTLQGIGHGIAAVLTGAKALGTDFYGYQWSPDSVLRIGVAAAALDEVVDTFKAGKNAVVGLNVEAFAQQAPTSKVSDADMSKIPVEAQAGYRALQATRAAGRFVSTFILADATITGDLGILGTTNDSLLRVGTGMAAFQQLSEGVSLGKDAVTGRSPSNV